MDDLNGKKEDIYGPGGADRPGGGRAGADSAGGYPGGDAGAYGSADAGAPDYLYVEKNGSYVPGKSPGSGEDGGEGESGGSGGYFREFTINTRDFYEQYGDEISRYISGRPGEDPMEALEEEEEDDGFTLPKKKRKKKHYLLKFMIVCAVIASLAAFLMSPYFEIKKIEVSGCERLKSEDIIRLSGVRKGGNIFRTGNGDVTAALEKEPYIREVQVSRELPGTFIITVKEREPAAMIRYGEQYIIIDGEGTVLGKPGAAQELPLIDGVTITGMKEGQMIEVKDEESLGKMLEIVRAMKKSGIYFRQVSCEKDIVRAYVSATLLCKGRYEDVLESTGSGVLEEVLRDLYGKKKTKGTVRIDGGKYISYSPAIE